MKTGKRYLNVGFILLLSILCLIVTAVPAKACTSFVVYGQEPVYGMNFDWYPTEIQFFQMEEVEDFFSFTWKYKGRAVGNVMMMDGLFFTSQELRPTEEGKRQNALLPNELLIGDLLNEIFSRKAKDPSFGVEEAVKLLAGKKLVQDQEFCMHSMLAESGGKAVVFETGAEENEITPMSGRFMVFTNFPIHQFKDLPYDEVKGPGAERYKTAWAHIEKNFDSFNLEHALEALKKTAQSNTRISMVLLPQQHLVYFALDRDFSRLWVADLEEKTIATYLGFGKTAYTAPITEKGIRASDLRTGAFVKMDAPSPYLLPAIIIGGTLIAALLGYFLLRKRIWKMRLNRLKKRIG